MTPTGALVVAVAAGVLLGAVPPATAAVDAGPSERVGRRAQPGSERQALALLQAASRAGSDRSYNGRQVVAWDGAGSGSSLARVAHDPDRGWSVDAAEPLPVTAALDRRQLGLLAAAYDLAVSGPGRCTGRTAHVVSAHRGDGTLAGRFWLDRRSGLLLRREVYDGAGSRVRSSAFVEVSVGPEHAPGPGAGADDGLPQASTLAALRGAGWQVPASLPGGFRLFDTRRSAAHPGQEVVQTSYSDGLSTVSLFAQRGSLGTVPPPGFRAETVDARPVWVRRDGPERVVWGGEGRVWTLVSDAPAADVRDAVAALPRDAAPGTGLRARLGRGLGRLGGMLNPFD